MEINQADLATQEHNNNPISQPTSTLMQTLKPKQKSKKQALLELTAISGEYPADNIHQLIPASSYVKKLVIDLVNEKQLKLVSNGGMKGYRLDYKGKRKLLEENPDRFKIFLEGGSETNRARDNFARRLRLRSLAEVYTIMYNTGTQIFQDMKPNIYFADAPSQSTNKDINNEQFQFNTNIHSYFYSSRELKGGDDKYNAIRGSRAAGIFITPENVYAMYNAGNSEPRWNFKTEKRFMDEIQFHICQGLLHGQYNRKVISGILIGENIEMLNKYLSYEAKQKSNFKFLTNTYQPLYYITNDIYGIAQLKLLCDETRLSAFKKSLLAKFHSPDIKYPIEHDALMGDKFVLFCCLLDIPRLHRFRKSLKAHGRKAKVLAFDFQIKMLTKYFGEEVELISYKFEKFNELFPSD